MRHHLLFKITPNPSVDEMRQVAIKAFRDVSKLSEEADGLRTVAVRNLQKLRPS